MAEKSYFCFLRAGGENIYNLYLIDGFSRKYTEFFLASNH